MFLIDTNIHAAYILKQYENDPLTVQYTTFYKQLSLKHRLVPDFILGEFETLLLQAVPSRYKLDTEEKQELKKLVHEYITDIRRDYPLITSSEDVVRKAFEIYHTNFSTRYISFTDSLLLALASAHQYTLLTKDQKLHVIAQQMRIPFYQPE